MRTGFNPHKDQPTEKSDYLHQIIIPVFIPNFEGYFKDSFEILKLCLESVFTSTHNKTFITIVNNGSCETIKVYLNALFDQNKIHEVIHTTNIGKLNAILKGIAGNAIELVTISDSDVLFLKGWQQETTTIFKELPKVGVVGIVPQFNMHKVHSSNLLFDNFFSNKVKFIPVKNKEALVSFYDSIGWEHNYNTNYLEYSLGMEVNNDLKILVGSGHFVATYKKDIFSELVSNIPYKMGGNSEYYLDELPLKKDYWRVTTHDNFAFHLGNKIEEWMNSFSNDKRKIESYYVLRNFQINSKLSHLSYIIKNKIFKKLLFNSLFLKHFYKTKKLPKSMINNY